MSQDSVVLPTTGTVSGLAMTQATNNALGTLNSLWSGASAPSSPVAGQFWRDTTNNILKLRSLDNTQWIGLLSLSESSYLSTPYMSAVTSGGNRIVNGGHVVDQGNEGSAYSIPTSNSFTYATDQWEAICNSATASGLAAQRVTDAPTGFTNSLKLTVGTGASSVGSSDVIQIQQPIEGAAIADLAFGSASASPVSLSFWVKASITGTFSVLLANPGGARTYVATFAITSAGTWQKVTIANIPGDQSGSWPTTTAQSLSVSFIVAAGSGLTTTTLNAWQSGAFLAANTQTNTILTTSGASFQFTGVMLTSGAFCPPFEKKIPSRELQECQRYFEKTFDVGTAPGTATYIGSNINIAAGAAWDIDSHFKVTKRATPSITLYSPQTGATGKVGDAASSSDVTGTPSNIGMNGFATGFSSTTGHTYGVHFTASARM